MDVETTVSPPEPAEDEGGDIQSARLSVSLLRVDDVHLDAALQLFGEDAEDADRIAEALLAAALALGALAGPGVAWAVAQRFAAYDGSMPG